MKRRVLLVAAALVVLLVIAIVGRPSGTSYRHSIVDASWPNCKTAPGDAFAVGIVGVTGGLDFHANPCAGEEAGWFGHYAVYMNTGYPGRERGQRFKAWPRHCGSKDNRCLGYNYGYNAALYAIRQADLQNVHGDLWWLDVETENSWTDNYLVNRQFINGAIAAIHHKIWFSQVGIYSAPLQWQEIMGPWHNRLPAWIATGATKESAARKACRGKAFTGGKTWLSQYTVKFDQNHPCSGRFLRTVTNNPYRYRPFSKA